MTPLPLSVPATNVPHTHVRRQDLSELIAGIPHVVGASPSNSLILYTFGGTESIRLATTLIGRLPPPTAVASLAARALTAARLVGATAVIAVVVGGAETPTPSNPLPHRVLVETLRYTFESEGIVLVHASWVGRTAPGEPWRCYDDITCHDMVPDAVTSTLTAAASVAGVGAFSTREDLAALLAPDSRTELAERSTLLDEQLKKPSAPYTAEELTADLELIKQSIDRARTTRQLPTFTDSELVRLAHAIAQSEVRDECLMIALGPGSDAAERVWLTLVRALPAPERAEAAFLLAMSTFLRGEVVVSALALESVLEANPAHELAPILTTNLTAGTTPTQLRSMLVESVIRAAELRAQRATDDDPPWETTPLRPADPDGTTPVTPSRPTESHPFFGSPEEVSDSLDTPTPFPEHPEVAGLFLPQPLTAPVSPPVADSADVPTHPEVPPAPTFPDVVGVPALNLAPSPGTPTISEEPPMPPVTGTAPVDAGERPAGPTFPDVMGVPAPNFPHSPGTPTIPEGLPMPPVAGTAPVDAGEPPVGPTIPDVATHWPTALDPGQPALLDQPAHVGAVLAVPETPDVAVFWPTELALGVRARRGPG